MKKIYIFVLLIIPFLIKAQSSTPFVFIYDTLNTPGAADNFSLTINNEQYPCFDFNADGNLDILMCNFKMNLASLQLFLGKGDGRFMPPLNVFRDNIDYINTEHIGDFNNDKLPDILLHKRSNQGDTLWVLMNKGNGTFTETSKVYVPEIQIYGICVADFNNDGKADFAGSNYCYIGNGNGTFAKALKYSQNIFVYTVITGDFNGDNKVDIAEIGKDSIRTYLGKGDGSFSKYKGTKLAFTSTESWETADFNGDGNMDFVICDMSNYLKVFLSNGDGTFTMKTDVNKCRNTFHMVTKADIDGDGKMDLLESTDSIRWFKGKGDGTFERVKYLSNYMLKTSSTFIAPTAVGDFNNDGNTDFAFTKSIGTLTNKVYGMCVLLKKPVFEAPVAINAIQKYKEYAVLFQWTNYKNIFATGLKIEIASDVNFKNMLKTETNKYNFLTDTMEYVFPYVNGVKEYYCRVKAFNTNDTSEFSNVFHLTLGTTEVKALNTENIKIFPNPVSDLLNIRVETPVQIEIYSITGELMVKENINFEKQIDVKSWAKGVYYIRSSQSGEISDKKLIVQ